MEKQVNKEFANICNWFVDNKLSIHFGEDKAKSILFAAEGKINKVPILDIIYNNTQMIQHSWDAYLACKLEETTYGKSMAHKVISRVNSRLKFSH